MLIYLNNLYGFEFYGEFGKEYLTISSKELNTVIYRNGFNLITGKPENFCVQSVVRLGERISCIEFVSDTDLISLSISDDLAKALVKHIEGLIDA